MIMKELIRNILKEELQGQEFIDNYNQEKQRFERTKDDIIDYVKSLGYSYVTTKNYENVHYTYKA